jgi:Bacterial SH3 domain
MTTIGTVKSPGLNVRARPALHAKKLDALGRGDEVEILDRAAPYGYAWLKVKARNTGMGSGVTGWVYAADIDIAPPVLPDVTPPKPAPQPPSPAPTPARSPRGFLFAAVALAAGIALIAWLLG